MAYPTSFISATALPIKTVSFILLILASKLLECHANAQHALGRHYHSVVHTKHHKPKFKCGPWKKAHATFYEGNSASFGKLILTSSLIITLSVCLFIYLFIITFSFTLFHDH